MGQRLARVTFVNPDLLWHQVVKVLQEVFILARACAQGDEKRSGLEHRTCDILNQVVAFLSDESGDDGDDRALWIFRQIKTTQ